MPSHTFREIYKREIRLLLLSERLQFHSDYAPQEAQHYWVKIEEEWDSV